MHRGFIFVLIFISHFAFAQTENVKLAWVHMPGATSYEIEVESAGRQGRPLIVRAVAIPEIAVDLPPGSYVYRVRGVADKGKGPWSEKQPLEVKLETIALLIPAADFKTETGSRVRFTWKGASGYRYRIQISDAKAVVTDRETTDSFFIWPVPSAGQFRWRVAYANVTQAPWSEYRTVSIQQTPQTRKVGTVAAAKVEKPPSRWNKTIWAGANMNSYDGDFADTGNNVTASTLSGAYSFDMERRFERFSSYSEPRPSFGAGVRQQSLVKKTVWLPDLTAAYSHLWTIGYLKLGPMVELGYGKTGFFTADAFQTYNFGSFWRSTYTAGIYGEYLFSKFMLSSFAKFGSRSGGDSSLAPGGVEPSTVMEAGIGAKLLKASRWTLGFRFFKEDVKWTSAAGDNSLTSTNWTMDLGGEI